MSRMMWLLNPEITNQMVMEEAKRLHIIFDIKTDDAAFQVAPKLGSLTDEEWTRLRSACYARIGVTDPEKYESDRLRELPFYKTWQREFLKPRPFRVHKASNE